MDMHILQSHRIRVLLGLILFSLQACAAGPTATPAPETPAATPIPLGRLVTLSTISFREEGQAPLYVISARSPVFAGVEHPHVQAFNEAVHDLVQREIEYFRENVLAQMPVQRISSGSSFDAQYALISQRDQIWSFKFDFSGYADGAAHSYRYSLTFNYDLEQGTELDIGELFPPDSEYLDVISRYCIAELSKRDIGFYGGFRQGAEPTPGNYRNWNITPDGLLITFDEYQVAPYAAGPQAILVPYAEINSLIKPKSPLAMFQP